MKRKYLQPQISAIVVLLAIVACVSPGQAPAPVNNPVNIETAVAGTGQAAAQQTQQAIPATATIAPADAPTATPKVSSSGTSLITLSDGSTQFTDYVAGMQLVLPAGWLVVRVGEEEYYSAWGNPQFQTPAFMDILAGIQTLDPKTFRMHGLDLRPDHIISNDITLVGMVFSQGDLRDLKEVQSDEKRNHPRYKGYKTLSSKLFNSPQGMQAVNMEAQWQTGNGASQTGLSYHRRVLYKLSTGVVAIDLYTLMDKKDLTAPDFDALLNSISFSAP